MPARLAFKPDSSFFRKIVVGAVGARAVCEDLGKRGHRFVELERGSTNSKLWKDVKRKRVRIPDLVCLNCGTRIECRARTSPELSMSHSPTDEERAWDFGMIDNDWIAFPVCSALKDVDWANGKLTDCKSYWRQKSWVEWKALEHINYFTVEAFRARLHAKSRTKGVEEGSENFIAWEATFSSRRGPVLSVNRNDRKIKIALADGTRPYTWTGKDGTSIFPAEGDLVESGQIIIGSVPPLARSSLACRRQLPADHIATLLSSRQRTQRFTGLKLARLRNEPGFEEHAREMANDKEEDVYVRLEAISYLVGCCKHSARQPLPNFNRASRTCTTPSACCGRLWKAGLRVTGT